MKKLPRSLRFISSILIILVQLFITFPALSHDKDQLNKAINDFIKANPEAIEEALISLDAKRKAEAEAQRRDNISQNADILFNSTRQVVVGNPNGEVTLVEFYDYNCGFCRRGLADLERLLKEDDNLRVVFKELPILSQNSVDAAKIAIAVSLIAPEKYMEFHSALLNGRAQNDANRARSTANKLGIKNKEIDEKLKDPEIDATIEEVYMLASSLGISGTPTYVVGKEVLQGAVGYDQLKEKLEAARK